MESRGEGGKVGQELLFSRQKEALQFMKTSTVLVVFYIAERLFLRMYINLHRGVRISDWFCLEYGINDIYILNRKKVQHPLHVISSTRDLKLINSITRKQGGTYNSIISHIQLHSAISSKSNDQYII